MMLLLLQLVFLLLHAALFPSSAHAAELVLLLLMLSLLTCPGVWCRPVHGIAARTAGAPELPARVHKGSGRTAGRAHASSQL
jgi:hypothetical protein